MVEATAPVADTMTVYHCDSWVSRLSAAEDAAIQEAVSELWAYAAVPAETVGGAALVTAPVAMPRALPFAEQARRAADALGGALGGKPIDAAVVHAHVGLLGGIPALRNMRPDARLFVTEHATFLDRMLAEPDGRAGYAEVLAACEAFFVVGDELRQQLAEAFPEHEAKLKLIANPIDFDVPRAEPVTELRRWLFVGGLIERKGVRWLLEAFAACRADDPSLTLTVVGTGELNGWLTERAAELGVADAITLTGALAPEQALELMREHDLLVHPSRYETFGVVIIEALAAGMPVLITRSGGPEQTLAGIEADAGELVEIEDAPDALIAGYQRLRGRFPSGLDQAHARAVLADRYGYGAVARSHQAAWFASSYSGQTR
ncbi:glycosyltransferase family 4 protein [Actinoplanes sp. NBC_00393]|uniref:glycosyltransferase family 4 protein n=1 Tax=Actinoplanes sp. NBC_00393 TaxID=2975953 RepID=UPI002E1EE3A3